MTSEESADDGTRLHSDGRGIESWRRVLQLRGESRGGEWFGVGQVRRPVGDGNRFYSDGRCILSWRPIFLQMGGV